MGYNASSNTLRELTEAQTKQWADKPHLLFREGEEVTVKGVVFTIHEIGLKRLVLEPVRAAEWFNGRVGG